jgi:hypothetical protein
MTVRYSSSTAFQMISNIQAQQQSIIVVTRIIDAVFVNDERVSEGTNLQEVLPIAARARQA